MKKVFQVFLIISCLFTSINPIIAEESTNTVAIKFSDISVDNTPHFDDIVYLQVYNITTGYPDGTFRPYGYVARCDMAAFLRRVAQNLGITDAKTWTPTDSDYQSFIDVNSDTPHVEDILWLAHVGISEGWETNKGKEFRPEECIARCDMAAFITRLAKIANDTDATTYSPSSDYNSFLDVNGQTPHINEVLWLAHSGISEGWTTNKGKEFRPYDLIARCDMAAFLHRLALPINRTSIHDWTKLTTEEKRVRYACNYCSHSGTIQAIGDEYTKEAVAAHEAKVPNHPYYYGVWHGPIGWYDPYPENSYYCADCGKYKHEHHWYWSQLYRYYTCTKCFQKSDDGINGYTSNDIYELSYDFENSGIEWEFTSVIKRAYDGKIYLSAFSIPYTRSLTMGETYQLKPELSPSDINVPFTLSYSSSNSSVATVDQNGLIYAVSPGTATITVKSDTAITRTCEVTVYKDDESNIGKITSARLVLDGQDITDKTITLKRRTSYTLKIVTEPSNAYYDADYDSSPDGYDDYLFDFKYSSKHSYDSEVDNTLRVVTRTGTGTITVTVKDKNYNKTVLTATIIVE